MLGKTKMTHEKKKFVELDVHSGDLEAFHGSWKNYIEILSKTFFLQPIEYESKSPVRRMFFAL